MSIERLIMKNKKKPIIDIKLTEEDIKISLLELKRKVGSPRLNFGIK
tara:strand:- start:339 stop:479 length:141 start_codon:yes stop_codon:yes gene_type:complete